MNRHITRLLPFIVTFKRSQLVSTSVEFSNKRLKSILMNKETIFLIISLFLEDRLKK